MMGAKKLSEIRVPAKQPAVRSQRKKPDELGGLTEALTSDHHFEQAGFERVLK